MDRISHVDEKKYTERIQGDEKVTAGIKNVNTLQVESLTWTPEYSEM